MSILQKSIGFRPWRTEDAPELTALADNPRIACNLRDGFPQPYTEEDALDFIAISSNSEPVYNYAVTLDDKVVGGIGYLPGHDVHKVSAEIGYWLGEKYWGKGIGTHAVKIFSEFVFATTGILHLHAGIFDYNKASARVLEKAGYTFVGKMHNCAVKNGRLIGLLHYELLSIKGLPTG